MKILRSDLQLYLGLFLNNWCEAQLELKLRFLTLLLHLLPALPVESLIFWGR